MKTEHQMRPRQAIATNSSPPISSAVVTVGCSGRARVSAVRPMSARNQSRLARKRGVLAEIVISAEV